VGRPTPDIGASAEVIMPELVNRGELKWDAQPCSGRAPPEVSSYLMVHTCTGCGYDRIDCEVDASGNWCFECRCWMDHNDDKEVFRFLVSP